MIESAATGSASVMLTLSEFGISSGHDVSVVYSPVRASNEFLNRATGIPGLQLIPVTMHRTPGLHDLKAGFGLRSIFKLGQYDVIHSHSSKAGALARLAGFGLRSLQVYSPHGFVTMGNGASKLYGKIERALSPLADAIIAVSQREKEHGLALGIADKKIFVVPNGIHTDGARRSKVAAVAQPFTVGFVGRLSYQKNPILALRAFRKLVDVYPDSSLIMIGDGEYEVDVKMEIEALDLADNVSLLGACSAHSYYPKFDVLLCTSRFEGMSLTFLEALAHGIPIISTDVGGVDELISNQETGFICPATDTALGAKLIKLAGLNIESREKLVAHALNRVGEFGVDTMFDRTMQLYTKLGARALSDVFP